MKTTLAVILAAGLFGAGPALAYDPLSWAVSDDLAPPVQPRLPPAVEAQVLARDGGGLSQAGFYNDPSVYMGRVEVSDFAHEDYLRHRHGHGPYVIESPYGVGRWAY